MKSRYTEIVHAFLSAPGASIVIATTRRDDVMHDLMKLLKTVDKVVLKDRYTIKSEKIGSYIRIATIDNIREAHRFAGTDIQLLCVDMYMPYYAEEFMRARIRNRRLENGDIFEGKMIDLD